MSVGFICWTIITSFFCWMSPLLILYINFTAGESLVSIDSQKSYFHMVSSINFSIYFHPFSAIHIFFKRIPKGFFEFLEWIKISMMSFITLKKQKLFSGYADIKILSWYINKFRCVETFWSWVLTQLKMEYV